MSVECVSFLAAFFHFSPAGSASHTKPRTPGLKCEAGFGSYRPQGNIPSGEVGEELHKNGTKNSTMHNPTKVNVWGMSYLVCSHGSVELADGGRSPAEQLYAVRDSGST